jgi:hypothetical protein
MTSNYYLSYSAPEWKIPPLMMIPNSSRFLDTWQCPRNLRQIVAYVDVSFASHPDWKGHTGLVVKGGAMMLGTIIRKQKIATKISTEAELLSRNYWCVMWSRESKCIYVRARCELMYLLFIKIICWWLHLLQMKIVVMWEDDATWRQGELLHTKQVMCSRLWKLGTSGQLIC